MRDAKIDPSLAEVRQWREKVQGELAHFDSEAEIAETHWNRQAQSALQPQERLLTHLSFSISGIETLDHPIGHLG